MALLLHVQQELKHGQVPVGRVLLKLTRVELAVGPQGRGHVPAASVTPVFLAAAAGAATHGREVDVPLAPGAAQAAPGRPPAEATPTGRAADRAPADRGVGELDGLEIQKVKKHRL